MLVFTNQNLVLLAVPKTGTTALHRALSPIASMSFRDPPGIKHASYARYRRFVRPICKHIHDCDPEVVSVIRHPIDWLSSWYRYRYRDKIVGKPKSTRDVTFDQFVIEYCKGKPATFANVGSQANFVFDNDGEQVVDYVFRYEKQPVLIDFLEDRLEIEIKLDTVNVSPSMEVEASKATIARLEKRRPQEFEAWEAARAS